MKHKKLFISLTAVFSVIILLSMFLIIWFLGDSYKDFDDNFTKEFKIAGLKDGAVPQGLGNCSYEYEVTGADGEKTKKYQQYFFMTAYMVDGSASRIYVTGADTGYEGYVTMKNVDGSEYKGHCGGIATNGTFLYVTGEGNVYVAKASSTDYATVAAEIITKAKLPAGDENKFVQFTASFDANCGADFCFYYDDPATSKTYDRLYVGEFYRKGKWDTDASHHITTPNGLENTAFAYEYYVNVSAEPYGLTKISDDNVAEADKVPKIQKIISIPEKIQGFARAGNAIALSQSYSLANSHILVYDWAKLTTTENSDTFLNLKGKNFPYNGVNTKSGVQYTDKTVRVYFADSNNSEVFLNDYSIPSMSEGMCTVGNKVYVLFESAGKKYRLFVREQLKYVYSFRLRNN
ncbi:MAG: hypothetical protein K2I30_05990 [Clostridia bacterium]|nr:hypothetical protein [Clostridia bacterium]